MARMSLSSRIKSSMSALGLTQETVANRAGLSQGMVYKLVSGKAKGTSKIVELANALECDPEWLATGHSKNELREQVAVYEKGTRLSVDQLKKEFSQLPKKEKKTIALELIESLIDESNVR